MEWGLLLFLLFVCLFPTTKGINYWVSYSKKILQNIIEQNNWIKGTPSHPLVATSTFYLFCFLFFIIFYVFIGSLNIMARGLDSLSRESLPLERTPSASWIWIWGLWKRFWFPFQKADPSSSLKTLLRRSSNDSIPLKLVETPGS